MIFQDLGNMAFRAVHLELLISEAMKLFRSKGKKAAKHKNDENVLHLEITEVILAHCNNVNIDYQHNLRVFFTFDTYKSFN